MKLLLSLITLLFVVYNQAQCNFTISTFGPGGDFLYTYANKSNFFPPNFHVCFHQILNSTDQFIRLAAGDNQVIQTFADNIIGRTMAIDSVREPDLCMLTGGDLAPEMYLSGNINNGILKAKDLQNKDILVDSAETGAVVVLYKILHDLNITNNTFTSAGGSARLGNLASGTYLGKPTYATMNVFPSTVPPDEPADVDNLVAAKHHFWPYQSGAYGSNCSWAQANNNVLVTYFEGIARAYYFFSTNRTGGIAWLQSQNPTWTPNFTQNYYDYYFRDLDGPATGYSLIPNRAAVCKDVVTRQAIQNYNMGYWNVFKPQGKDKLPDPWEYAKPTNKPNQLATHGKNKYNGPVYLKALQEAIENITEDLGLDENCVGKHFSWADPTSECKVLCDINVRLEDN